MKCYLCGATEKPTLDHVPPKGFFPHPRPSNLITVLCCESCNNAYSKDDEATRLWFSCLLGASPAAQWILENKVLPNTLQRAPSLRAAMLATMEDTKLLTEDGEIEVTRFSIPIERPYRFVIRIVKGLLSCFYPAYDYSEARFEICRILQTEDNLKKLESLRDMLPYDFRGDGVFQYRGGLTESGMSGVWMIVFYEAILFVVAHTKNNWGKAGRT